MGASAPETRLAALIARAEKLSASMVSTTTRIALRGSTCTACGPLSKSTTRTATFQTTVSGTCGWLRAGRTLRTNASRKRTTRPGCSAFHGRPRTTSGARRSDATGACTTWVFLRALLRRTRLTSKLRKRFTASIRLAAVRDMCHGSFVGALRGWRSSGVSCHSTAAVSRHQM